MNPFLKDMGYGPKDRVVVINADDVGMCQASLAAYADLCDAGGASTGSVMAPCPWFPATAAWAKAHPQADLGVHVTLTCEWDAYRWGPVAVHDPAAGLLDSEGYFPRATQQVWEQASVTAALAEAEAQIDRALTWGIDVTHIDDHMLTWRAPEYRRAFTDLILRRRLPQRDVYLAPERPDAEPWEQATRAAALRFREAGVALFDAFHMLPLDNPHGQPDLLRAVLDRTPRGKLTLIVTHPAIQTPELEAIAPDWPSRVANYEALMCPDLRAWVKNEGIQVIGFRALRDAAPSRP